MTSSEIRKTFLDFFADKQHHIVPSAPIVVKNDPTLMFTNAGMNQFKNIFLGNQPPQYKRIADTQKCLRVSGKHNDLEEVGVDTYHHTMFEMLGNWSFGDYFKKDAIAWAWELLTEVYKLPKERLYVTVFEGDEKENLKPDEEAREIWKNCLAASGFSSSQIEHRIINGNKKDNFWEMGDNGPCGPCSEIHFDLRDEYAIINGVDGRELVNKGDPHVIEIWNNVFMEFNRKWKYENSFANMLKFEHDYQGNNYAEARAAELALLTVLEPLPQKHVDTGMGFERLCVAIQGKKSNYDTDVFQPTINYIEAMSGITYAPDTSIGISSEKEAQRVAMRVMADHIRAIAFTIADGQLPSNNGAGYVIRRILRRAVRYAYTFLNLKDPFLNRLVPLLANQFEDVFPELVAQKEFVQNVVREEETSFLRTLEKGIKRFEEYLRIKKSKQQKSYNEFGEMPTQTSMSGDFAFELYDTYGFPIDLTELMARENFMEVDLVGFNKCLAQQKERSRAASVVNTDDWVIVNDDESEFVGYDELDSELKIIKYRKVKSKNKEQFQMVFSRTPFYAESGGQVGDTGYIQSGNEKISITDTQKENNLFIHIADKLPADVNATFHGYVNANRRSKITSNHSATHLMHSALKQVLGNHVAQKGSLVNDEQTRFDFSHFAKVTDEELQKIERIVNEKIRENILLDEKRNLPIEDAKAMGATALFGEKYGDFVRVITFDPSYSMELCGGTHVPATGKIGAFKIVAENAVAAGVRRIEAITAENAEKYFEQQTQQLQEIKSLLKNPKELTARVQSLLDENENLRKQLDALIQQKAQQIKNELLKKVKLKNGINVIAEKIDLDNADAIKTISFELRNQLENAYILLGSGSGDKATLSLIVSDNLVKEKNLNASTIIRTISKNIQGGGGGQPFYATAGGKNADGIATALEEGVNMV